MTRQDEVQLQPDKNSSSKAASALKNTSMSPKAALSMTAESHMRKRALVTGGAGQDGWYLIELLLSRGYDVFAHSRRPADPGLHGGRVSWHTGDLTDEDFLEDLLSLSATRRDL